MAAAARMKPFLQHPSAGLKCISAGTRHVLWTGFVAILLLCFLARSSELLYSRNRWPLLRTSSIKPPVSDKPLLQYSQSNPAVVTERQRIKLLLEKTELGRISIRDVLYSSRNSGDKNMATSRSSSRQKLMGKAWMLPLTSRVFDAHVPKFFQLAQSWLGDGDFDPNVMQELVETVKMPLERNAAKWSIEKGRDEIPLPGRNRYQSCAVVGNSGILLNGSYGEQIDSHEMVIRLNNAEISQYEKHVGTKTTLSFMNSNVFRICSARSDCWCHPYGEEVPVIMYICQAQHLMHAARCTSMHKSPLLVTHSLLDALCAAIVKWYSIQNFVQTTGKGVDEWDSVHHDDYFHYSSGMQAIVLALGICDRVEIFGFGKFADQKHHYHTQQKKELNLHDYAAEYLFYDDLVHDRKIPFLSDANISMPLVLLPSRFSHD